MLKSSDTSSDSALPSPAGSSGRSDRAIARIFDIWTGDGQSLFSRAWGDRDVPAAFVVVHGLGDYGGTHDETAQRLVPAGFGVLAYDQRGHGLTPGRRGDADVARLIDDLENVLAAAKEQFPRATLLLCGHSMGGNVALQYCLQQRSHVVAGLAAICPLLFPPRRPTRPQLWAAKITGRFLPWLRVTGSIEPEKLTDDAAKQLKIAQDPLIHAKMSLRLGTQLINGGQWILDNAGRLTLPSLWMLSENDDLINNAAIEELHRQTESQSQLIRYPEGRHDLLASRCRDQAIADLISWAKKVCPKQE